MREDWVGITGVCGLIAGFVLGAAVTVSSAWKGGYESGAQLPPCTGAVVGTWVNIHRVATNDPGKMVLFCGLTGWARSPLSQQSETNPSPGTGER